MEKKEERRFTEEEFDDSDYGEPDSVVVVTEDDILKGEI